jgi:hypothetical protein
MLSGYKMHVERGKEHLQQCSICEPCTQNLRHRLSLVKFTGSPAWTLKLYSAFQSSGGALEQQSNHIY